MTEPLPVTQEHKLLAWRAMFAREPELAHIPINEPDPADPFDEKTLEGLGRVLEADRKLVAELTHQP